MIDPCEAKVGEGEAAQTAQGLVRLDRTRLQVLEQQAESGFIH
jgi:hypothetical protein